jgi:hypothetical protein
MEIASNLQISHSTVGNDLGFIKREAQEHLHNHIQETIPSEYSRAMTSMDSVLKMAWAIVSRTQDDKTKLQGLALIKDCTNSRIDMSANAPIISGALKYITQQKEQLALLQKVDDKIEEIEEETTTTNGVF